jgi:hypothetical protein
LLLYYRGNGGNGGNIEGAQNYPARRFSTACTGNDDLSANLSRGHDGALGRGLGSVLGGGVLALEPRCPNLSEQARRGEPVAASVARDWQQVRVKERLDRPYEYDATAVEI